MGANLFRIVASKVAWREKIRSCHLSFLWDLPFSEDSAHLLLSPHVLLVLLILLTIHLQGAENHISSQQKKRWGNAALGEKSSRKKAVLLCKRKSLPNELLKFQLWYFQATPPFLLGTAAYVCWAPRADSSWKKEGRAASLSGYLGQSEQFVLEELFSWISCTHEPSARLWLWSALLHTQVRSCGVKESSGEVTSATR